MKASIGAKTNSRRELLVKRQQFATNRGGPQKYGAKKVGLTDVKNNASHKIRNILPDGSSSYMNST